VEGSEMAGNLLTSKVLRGKKIGVGNSGLAATSNPVSQVLW